MALCPDGLCAAWCAPHEGCPLRAPLRCPDASCHADTGGEGGGGGSLGLAVCRGGCAAGEVACYGGGCVAEAEVASGCATTTTTRGPWEEAAVAVRARTYASALPSTLEVEVLGGSGAGLATLRLALAAGAPDVWVRAAPVAASVSARQLPPAELRPVPAAAGVPGATPHLLHSAALHLRYA